MNYTIKNPAGGRGLDSSFSGQRFHVDHATAEPLLQRLERVKKSGKGWRSRCPACGGKSEKLVVTEVDGKVLLHCFAGCSADEVLAAVGLSWGDIMPPRYWPESPEDRRQARRAIREAGLISAISVLGLEVAVVHVAAAQILRGGQLTADDLQRVKEAHIRIGASLTIFVEARNG